MRTIFKLIAYLAALLLVLFLVSVVGVAYLNKKISEPFKQSAEAQIFEIGQGDKAKEVAENLENANIIADKNYFLFYLWQSGGGSKLKAGKYSLSASESIKVIVHKMVSGETVKNDINITIPEGFTISNIDKRLSDNKVIQSDDLKKYDIVFNKTATSFLKDYDFLSCDNKQYFCTLEGYLFPDTYRFSVDDLPLDPRVAIDKFLNNFSKKTKDLREKSRESGKDFRDILIMASIIEKEVQTPEDMKTVSGVLWKRLSIGMPLQVDATIVYITGKKTGEITYDDLKIDSPYNSYLNKGLPPSPISNPGISAIEAALDPVDKGYLYYLSKPTGETVFSKTLEEHNRAKAMYLK